MAAAILRYLPCDVTGHVMTGPFTGPGTGQDVDHVASSMRQSTSDHMAPAIRRSMLSGVDLVALAMRRSTSDHMASAILRSLPGYVTGHVMTGPFNGHQSLVTGPVRAMVSSPSGFTR
ncbi:hypothetical protein DPMN_030171 [Dreissena polymorpha]|uniref:Uncharacterized protein n=1 Tax=Dreissena polymorpha TaxID=45954 RepID=A0A9D4RFX5_DREPO|nr:hypothetical protein DPMN_030171 [Dreissena polymorpha]